MINLLGETDLLKVAVDNILIVTLGPFGKDNYF